MTVESDVTADRGAAPAAAEGELRSLCAEMIAVVEGHPPRSPFAIADDMRTALAARPAPPAAAEGAAGGIRRLMEYTTHRPACTGARGMGGCTCGLWGAIHDLMQGAARPASVAATEGDEGLRELRMALHVLYRAYRRRDALTFTDRERIERLLGDG